MRKPYAPLSDVGEPNEAFSFVWAYAEAVDRFALAAKEPDSEPTYEELKARLFPKPAPAPQPVSSTSPAQPYRSSHELDGGGLALGLAMGIGLGGMFHGF